MGKIGHQDEGKEIEAQIEEAQKEKMADGERHTPWIGGERLPEGQFDDESDDKKGEKKESKADFYDYK